jgi:hypothetical protein
MRNRYRFSSPPKVLRRSNVKLDNVALVPGNLLPFKSEYQEIANGLPNGGILIVLPEELKQRRVFEKTAVQLKNKGKRIATISATRLTPAA